jgi:ParB-like chromosome segregation protein Spo0J
MKAKPEVRNHVAEMVDIDRLRPHPQNYRVHPEAQREQIKESLRANGTYRNVVAARDWTVLAGHGVIEAARELGLAQVPVVRLPVGPDSKAALKILAGDNELARLAEVDDAQLLAILRRIGEADLLGSGFTAESFAELEKLLNPAAPGEFPLVGEDLPTDFKCPKCGFQWSGKPS